MILPDRMHSGEWVRDARIRALGRHLQLLLIMLRHVCDRNGRFEFSPADVHRALYVSVEDNVSARDVETWLEILRSRGLVKSYTGSNGRRVGEISRDYWRQKLAYGKSLFEPESGDPELDLSAEDPPPRSRARGSDMKGNEVSPQPPPPAAGEVKEPLYFSERLFQTMAELCGFDLSRMTTTARRRINAALRDIQRVHPDLLPADLERAAAAYRQLYRVDLTPTAMAAHWPKLMGSKCDAAAKAPSLIEPEPLGWRDWINENTPDVPFARGGEKEGTPWHDLDASYRRYLIEQCRKRDQGRAA